MNDLLAIDTSSSACSVALGRGEDLLVRHQEAPRQQIAIILPLVHELLAERGTTLAQLDGIAFGQGPGSFTGIRIALAVVQGLALAHGLPVVGVSSLAALAQGAHRLTGAKAILVAQDARMGEVYWGCYDVSGGAAALRGAEQLTLPAAVQPPDSRDWLAVGNAWQVHKLATEGMVFEADAGIPEAPHAQDVLFLADRAFAAGQMLSADQARPSYVRQRVAEPSGARTR
jgi:tRNA threonylcarbamoyladenosine biosynthesis protein TsaB